MRNLSKMIRNFWECLREIIARPVILSRLAKKYPECKFYPGVSIDDYSLLGKFNVIFKDVVINNSVIGDHTFIQKDSTINHASVGKFCSIAMRVTIGPGRHPTDYVSSHPAFYSCTQPLAKTYSMSDMFVPFKQTNIGHDVWIGQNVLIMDGVNVGTGAVIAAGAIVTKDVPEYAIVAGIPATIIRYRFDEQTRQKMLQTCWWEKSEDWLQKNAATFSNPHKFNCLP